MVNVCYTQYDVIQDAANESNFKLSTEEEDEWDIWWIDSMILPTLLHKMKWHQRTNHLPNIQAVARKNLLAQNLIRLQKVCPEEYNFFP